MKSHCQKTSGWLRDLTNLCLTFLSLTAWLRRRSVWPILPASGGLLLVRWSDALGHGPRASTRHRGHADAAGRRRRGLSRQSPAAGLSRRRRCRRRQLKSILRSQLGRTNDQCLWVRVRIWENFWRYCLLLSVILFCDDQTSFECSWDGER